jgi:hypothetical protein
MNDRSQMQGSESWILSKDINAHRFFSDPHWLEIWSNHFCSSMGTNGGSGGYGLRGTVSSPPMGKTNPSDQSAVVCWLALRSLAANSAAI